MRPRQDDRIAIIGAGPAGIHMAHLLGRRGFGRITLLERSERVGGRLVTVQHDGLPHDLGACYLSSSYHRVRALVDEYGSGPVVKPGGRDGHRDIYSSRTQPREGVPQEIDEWLLATAEQYTLPRALWWAPDRLQAGQVLLAIRRYQRIHREIFGEYTANLPPEPGPEAMSRIDMSFLDFLHVNHLRALIPVLLLSHAAQGYGLLASIPAFYGLWWNTPALLDGFLASERDPDAPVLSMLRHGYQPLFESIAQRDELDVRLGVHIDCIDRTQADAPVRITGRQGADPICWDFDFLIVAANLQDILQLLQAPTFTEIKLFSSMVSSALISTLFEADVRPDYACISYWPDVLDVGYPGRLYSIRNTRLCLEPGSSQPRGRDVYVAYQYVDHDGLRTDEWLEQALLEDLRAVGIETPTVIDQRVWRYFTRFTRDGIVRGYPWRLWDAQGGSNTWYIGSSACFDSVLDVLSYNESLLDRFALST